MEQQAESIILEAAHPVRDAADLLDDQVLGLDGSCGDAGHVEVEDLGLWLAWGDEGSVGWGRNHSVFSPDGTAHHFDGSQCHETVVSQAELLALCAVKTDSEVVAALRRHFDEGERSLGVWSLSEPEPEEEEEEDDDEDEGYDEDACSEYGGSREDGEGCDGLCGDCADRVDLVLESEGDECGGSVVAVRCGGGSRPDRFVVPAGDPRCDRNVRIAVRVGGTTERASGGGGTVGGGVTGVARTA